MHQKRSLCASGVVARTWPTASRGAHEEQIAGTVRETRSRSQTRCRVVIAPRACAESNVGLPAAVFCDKCHD